MERQLSRHAHERQYSGLWSHPTLGDCAYRLSSPRYFVITLAPATFLLIKLTFFLFYYRLRRCRNRLTV